jgi:hypothetical protein
MGSTVRSGLKPVDATLRSAARGPRITGAACALLLLIATCAACRRVEASGPRAQKPALTEQYAPGRYRLVEEQLPQVRLRFAQVLFSHAGTSAGAESLWLPHRVLTRARAQAAALATQASTTLVRDPEHFAEYAQQHSDDRASASLGGRLGILAGDTIPPALLDALATLKPGEVSRAIESEVGFHVIRRLAVPPEQTLAAQRIVVAWKDSVTLLRVGRRAERTRAEAAALAASIAAQAHATPGSFAQLVKRYSDHHDAVRDGFYGPYSSYHPSGNWTELELLAGLREGEVSPVLECAEGFVIFRRTPAPQAVRLAMTEVLVMPADSAARATEGAVARTRDEARALATDLLQTLRRDPSRFPELQQRYCCAGRRHDIQLGRELAGLGDELLKLVPGQIASQLVETPVGFHIVKREQPQPVAAPDVLLFELPAPAVLDVTSKVRTVRGHMLAPYVRKLAVPVINTFALGSAESNAVGQVFDQLARDFVAADSEPQRRLEAYRSAHARLRGLLGEARARRVQDIEAQWLSALLLTPRPPPPS